MTTETATPETDTRVQEALPCDFPGCEKTSATAHGIAVHKSRTHGVKGGQKRSNSKKAKAAKDAKLKASEPMTTSLMVTDGEFGIDGMLQAFFPAGIPSEKIPAVIKWIEATKELMA